MLIHLDRIYVLILFLLHFILPFLMHCSFSGSSFKHFFFLNFANIFNYKFSLYKYKHKLQEENVCSLLFL